jgi:hypothetical protein
MQEEENDSRVDRKRKRMEVVCLNCQKLFNGIAMHVGALGDSQVTSRGMTHHLRRDNCNNGCRKLYFSLDLPVDEFSSTATEKVLADKKPPGIMRCPASQSINGTREKKSAFLEATHAIGQRKGTRRMFGMTGHISMWRMDNLRSLARYFV